MDTKAAKGFALVYSTAIVLILVFSVSMGIHLFGYHAPFLATFYGLISGFWITLLGLITALSYQAYVWVTKGTFPPVYSMLMIIGLVGLANLVTNAPPVLGTGLSGVYSDWGKGIEGLIVFLFGPVVLFGSLLLSIPLNIASRYMLRWIHVARPADIAPNEAVAIPKTNSHKITTDIVITLLIFAVLYFALRFIPGLNSLSPLGQEYRNTLPPTTVSQQSETDQLNTEFRLKANQYQVFLAIYKNFYKHYHSSTIELATSIPFAGLPNSATNDGISLQYSSVNSGTDYTLCISYVQSSGKQPECFSPKLSDATDRDNLRDSYKDEVLRTLSDAFKFTGKYPEKLTDGGAPDSENGTIRLFKLSDDSTPTRIRNGIVYDTPPSAGDFGYVQKSNGSDFMWCIYYEIKPKSCYSAVDTTKLN